jgi:UDP-glucose 4-epimerase
MNVMLTGGMGYIGSHIAIKLASFGHTVLIYDNLSNSSEDVLSQIEFIIGSPIIFIKGDIRETEKLQKIFIEHKIDSVIHLAGLKAVGDSVNNPISYYENNISGAISLIKAMELSSVDNLIFSSSATVYGEPEYLPIDESHRLDVQSPYGLTKKLVEEIFNNYCELKSNNKVISLRYFNPVGAHPSGLIGERPCGIPNNLMPYIAQVANGEMPFLGVFGDKYLTKDGTGVRDYIHVEDLAEGHLAALNYIGSMESDTDVFNLGTGKGFSVLDVVQKYREASGKRIPIKIKDPRPGDVAECYACTKKASEVLDWRAKLNMSDMCNSSWNYQTKIKPSI